MTTPDRYRAIGDENPVVRPNMDQVANQLRRARLHLRLALNADSAIHAVKDMQQVVRQFRTSVAEADIRFAQDTLNTQAERDYIFFQDATRQLEHHLLQFQAALLSSRYLADIEAAFGSYLVKLCEASTRIHQDRTLDERQQEDRLTRRYRQLYSSITVEWQEQKSSLSAMTAACQDPDRTIRQQAHLAIDKSLSLRAGEMDDVLDELVDCRHQMAVQAGFSSFTEIGYIRLGRFDCTIEHMNAIHEDVRRYIVPLAREIRHLQRKRLKVEHLHEYDLTCFFPEGNPSAFLQGDLYIQSIDEVIRQFTEEKDFSIRDMIDSGLTDFEARSGKIPHSQMFFLPHDKKTYLMMQETSTHQDTNSLLSLTGQAFAYSRIMNNPDRIDPLRPDSETHLLYGAALPLLLLPQLKPIFDVRHDDYAAMYVTQLLLKLPELCLLDVFQHEIYRNPEMTPQQRNRLWRILEKKYLPDLDLDDASFMTSGRGWQMSVRDIETPFSAGSAVLADLTALELWRISLKNPARAQRHFLSLCQAGGSKSYMSLLTDENLPLPIDPDTLKRVAYAGCDALSL